MSGSSHILDTQVLRSDTGNRNTLRWLQCYVDKQEVCGKPGLPPPGACAQGLAPKPQWGGQIETAFVDACFLKNCQHLHTLCLLRVAGLHWSRGCLDQADSWDVWNTGASSPGRHVGGRAGIMLMEGIYIGGVSGRVLISNGGQTATADDPVCAQSPWGPHLPNSTLFNRAGIAESGGSDQLWGTKRSQTRRNV